MPLDLSDYEYSPWMPNIFTCVSNIVSNGFHETSERLPWSGIETWLFETVQSIPICNHDILSTIFPVVVAMFITVSFAVYSMGMIKLLRALFGLDFQVAAKFSKHLWSCFYCTATIIWGKRLIKFNYIFFFFHPATSLEEWNPCNPLTNEGHIFFLTQMAYHLHSFFYSFIDSSEKGRDFCVALASHITTTSLLALVFFLSLHEPLVIFLVLFAVRDLLWISFKVMTSMGNCGGVTICSILANILLVTCCIFQCIEMYWCFTKLIYFFAVIYPAHIKESPCYHLLQFLLWIIFAIEILRFGVMLKSCWKKASSLCLKTKPMKPKAANGKDSELKTD